MSQSSNFLYAGLSELLMNEQSFDLGRGVTVRSAYAHMFANYMLAYTPAPEGKPSPGPWKAARGGMAHDITAEVSIPADGIPEIGSAHEIARAIVLVVRLGINPASCIAALSNRPFDANAQASDADAWVRPEEVESRRFHLSADNSVVTNGSATWIADRWPVAAKLSRESAEFALAVDAITIGQYVHRSSLTMVAIWAALEALFSPSSSELKFRVSALIASFLESPGDSRRTRAKAVARLYDKRSAAAHGKPTHDDSDLLASFNLMAEVLRKILDQSRVPSKEELESMLFGITAAPPQ